MTDDYAAITAGVSVTLLLICVVEMHVVAGHAKRSVEEVSALPSDDDTFREEQQVLRDFWLTVVLLLACVVLSGSLLLTGLWAAIENHGPARWVAWGTLLSNAWGLLALVTVYLTRALNELQQAARAFATDRLTTTGERTSSEEGAPVPEG
ncbi:hypothetical protein [Streptomyces albogriseolus]|uniref:hypothetical protein n=1 Tax=Streptomyces albogriseolus TaxID=1887 RepID=UPI003CE86B2B